MLAGALIITPLVIMTTTACGVQEQEPEPEPMFTQVVKSDTQATVKEPVKPDKETHITTDDTDEHTIDVEPERIKTEVRRKYDTEHVLEIAYAIMNDIARWTADDVFGNMSYIQSRVNIDIHDDAEIFAIFLWNDVDRAEFLPVIFDTEYGRLGLYWLEEERSLMIYHGDYSGNTRSGEGIWYTLSLAGQGTDVSYETLPTIAIGEWADDAPNGSMSVFYDRWTGRHGIVTGSVKNGLWYGNVIFRVYTNVDRDKLWEVFNLELFDGIIRETRDDKLDIYWDNGDLTHGVEGYAELTIFDYFSLTPCL